ncbi:MAG: hypothetical protein GY756_02305 [bacterium]|nr:hypothetical protein [bacterium]
MPENIYEISWTSFSNTVDKLYNEICKDGKPDHIIGIMRGGLIPATILAHKFNIRILDIISITRTLSDKAFSAKTAPIVNWSSPLENIRGKDILIVDDVIGHGATYYKTVEIVSKYNPSRIRWLSCILNRPMWDKKNNIAPNKLINYIGLEIADWIKFPWSNLE